MALKSIEEEDRRNLNVPNNRPASGASGSSRASSNHEATDPNHVKICNSKLNKLR